MVLISTPTSQDTPAHNTATLTINPTANSATRAALTSTVHSPLQTINPMAQRQGISHSSEMKEMASLFTDLVDSDEGESAEGNTQEAAVTNAGPASLRPVAARQEKSEEQQPNAGYMAAVAPAQSDDTPGNRLDTASSETSAVENTNMRAQADDTNSREINLDSIGETINDFIESVLEIFADLGDMLKDFFDQFADSLDSIGG